MNERDYMLGELDRRLANIKREGTIAEIDHAKGLAKVDLGDMVTDWLPWQTPRAGADQVWNTPDVGEQVTVLSNGDPSQGTIIGSLFQDAHPQNGNEGKDRRITFKDGTVVEFDRDGSVLNVTVNSAGSVNVKVGSAEFHLQDGQATVKAPLVLVDSPNTHCTGNLTVDGALSFAGGMSGSGGGTTATFNGNVAVNGNVNATGSVTDGDGDGGA